MATKSHSNQSHHRFSPSAASRWLHCRGSIRLSEGITSETSVFAEEGRLAHDIAEKCLKNGINPATENAEMNEHIQTYLDFVRFNLSEFDTLLVEDKVDLSFVIPEGFGTADTIILSDDSIHIIDLKYGAGVPVSASMNPQLMIYAIGVFCSYRHIGDFKTIKLSIVQPRLDIIDTWELSIDDLMVFAEDVKEAVKNADSDNPIFFTSDKTCRFCPAKVICRHRAEYVLESARLDFPDVDKMDINELIKYYDVFDDLKRWISDVSDYIFKRALSGEHVPGYKLVEGRSNRKWIDGAEEKLLAILPESEVYDKKLKGIPQIEKKLGKKNEILQDLIVKPRGKPTLVPDGDKRQALASMAALDFDDLND